MANFNPEDTSSRRLLTQYEMMEKVLLNLDIEELCVVQRVSTFWKDLICRSERIQQRMFLLPSGPAVRPALMPIHMSVEDTAVINFPGNLLMNPTVEVAPHAHDYVEEECVPYPRSRKPARKYICPVSMRFYRMNPMQWTESSDEDNSEVEDTSDGGEEGKPPRNAIDNPSTWSVYVRVLAGDYSNCNASHLHKVHYPEAVARPEASWRKMLVTQPPITSIQFHISQYDVECLHSPEGLTFGEIDAARTAYAADERNHESFNVTQHLDRSRDEWQFFVPDLFAGNVGLLDALSACHAARENHREAERIRPSENRAPLCPCQEPMEQAILGIKWESDAQRTRSFEPFPKDWPIPPHSPQISELSDWGQTKGEYPEYTGDDEEDAGFVLESEDAMAEEKLGGLSEAFTAATLADYRAED